MQRQIPMFIVFVSGLTMIVDYFFPRVPYIQGAREIFLNWGRIALTFAMILGIMNLLMSNLRKVALRKAGWIYNVILLGSFALTFYFAVQYKMVPSGNTFITHKGTDMGSSGTMSFASKIFLDVYTPLSGTIFSLVAFFIASAAFRAFRAKNIEAILLLSSAIVVMLGSIPFGDSLFAWLGLEHILGHRNFSWLSTQIQQIPMSAAQRAINFGVAFGMVFMSIKILTGIDRSYFGGGGE